MIIQNLYIHDILDDDCITIFNSTRVWVDHNEFSSDMDGGPDKYVCEPSLFHVPRHFNFAVGGASDGLNFRAELIAT